MSCSDFSIDSLDSSAFINSNNKVKYVKQNITSNTECRLFDLMSVPLYSGPVSLQELKRIEVNGDKILEIETKEFSNINKKKHLSNTKDKSRLKNFKHPRRQGKNNSSRVYSINIEKIEQMKQTSTKSKVTTHKEYYKENYSVKKKQDN
eukprot:XP_008184024.1 PREDICTED: uncharacterized protein LOC103309690 [Acyrthosiphon pisum]